MRWVHPHTIRCAFICTASSQCRLDMSCHSHGNKVMFRHFCLFFFYSICSSIWIIVVAGVTFISLTTHDTLMAWCMYYVYMWCCREHSRSREACGVRIQMHNGKCGYPISHHQSVNEIDFNGNWEVFANRCTIAQNLPRMNHIAILNCIQFVGFCNLKRETTNILIYGYRLYILWVYKRCLSHMPGQRDTINCVSWCRIICMPVSVSGGSR